MITVIVTIMLIMLIITMFMIRYRYDDDDDNGGGAMIGDLGDDGSYDDDDRTRVQRPFSTSADTSTSDDLIIIMVSRPLIT